MFGGLSLNTVLVDGSTILETMTTVIVIIVAFWGARMLSKILARFLGR